MANELGRTVMHRYLYARSWGLGDRKSPAVSTPCLVALVGDEIVKPKLFPFFSNSDEQIPSTLFFESKLPLSPPNFVENEPNFRASIGHVLPPSLDEADAGELADNGELLPISWQRLNHDPKLSNEDLKPSIVVLVDAVQLATQQDKLVKALIVIKNRFPGALLWTPGLGGPDNAAVLTWFGVDIFDLARSRQCQSANLLLTESGPRALVDKSDESSDMTAQIARWESAINDIKANLVNGSLRTLVERQSLNSPKLVQHLRYHDNLSRENHNLGISHVQSGTILHCNSHTSLENPIVTDWVDFITHSYQVPKNLDNILILLPCSARKPYRLSKSHRKFLSAIGSTAYHEVMVTSPLGLVPRDLEEIWPASHYDIPVTGTWSLDEQNRTAIMLRALLNRHNYHTVINHSSMSFDLQGVDYYETRNGNSATSNAALDNLSKTISKVATSIKLKPRRHHQILRENFCSIARYKMVNDDWLSGVEIKGKPPYWKIEKSGKQIAQWSNERRGFSLSKSSIPIIAEHSSLRKIYLKSSVKWKGDIFSTIVETFDEGIKLGDDLLVIQHSLPIGLARAVASGWEWPSTPGIVAKGHQRIS